MMIDGQARNAPAIGVDAAQVLDDVGLDLERFDARGRIGHEPVCEMRGRFCREFVHDALALDRIERFADITRFEGGQRLLERAVHLLLDRFEHGLRGLADKDRHRLSLVQHRQHRLTYLPMLRLDLCFQPI